MNTYQETFYYDKYGTVINKGPWDFQDGANPLPPDAIMRVFTLPYPSIDGLELTEPATSKATALIAKLAAVLASAITPDTPVELRANVRLIRLAVNDAIRADALDEARWLISDFKAPVEFNEAKAALISIIDNTATDV